MLRRNGASNGFDDVSQSLLSHVLFCRIEVVVIKKKLAKIIGFTTTILLLYSIENTKPSEFYRQCQQLNQTHALMDIQ